jgi:opacity protein-like surface antigen
MSLGSYGRAAVATLVVSLGALTPAVARAADDDRGGLFYVQAGGYSPVEDLDDAGTSSFKTGLVVGGGIGCRFNRHLALRLNFNFAKTEADAPGRPVDGEKFNRFLYDADLLLRYPTGNRFSPYIFAGGGFVAVDRAVSVARGAAKFGFGFSYDLKDSGFSVFVEGTSWVYDFEDSGYDKTQFDVA